MIDYYEILGIQDQTASFEEIKKVFHEKKSALEMGLHKGPKLASEKVYVLEQTNEAYQVLSNPKTRGIYDQAYSLFKRNQEIILENNLGSEKSCLVEESKKKENLEDNIDKNKGYGFGWLIIIIVVTIYLILFSVTNNQKNKPLVNEIKPTQIQITKTPTVSIYEQKSNVILTATLFGNFIEEGNNEVKQLLDINSKSYQKNVEIIDQLIHDKLKYGSYWRLYDLSVSSISNNSAIVSGYLEERSYTGWYKFYINIILNNSGENWLISSWDIEKT